jgi:hypothetical protein
MLQSSGTTGRSLSRPQVSRSSTLDSLSGWYRRHQRNHTQRRAAESGTTPRNQSRMVSSGTPRAPDARRRPRSAMRCRREARHCAGHGRNAYQTTRAFRGNFPNGARTQRRLPAPPARRERETPTHVITTALQSAWIPGEHTNPRRRPSAAPPGMAPARQTRCQSAARGLWRALVSRPVC